MKLHITRFQIFRNDDGSEDVDLNAHILNPGEYLPVGQYFPLGDFELVPVSAVKGRAPGSDNDASRSGGEAARPRGREAQDSAPAAAPLSGQGQARPGVGTRTAASPQNGSANPKPRPGAVTRILGKESHQLISCRPTKVAEATSGGAHLLVQYYSAQPTGSGRTEAAEHFMGCWDKELFSAIKATVHQDAEFYVERRTKNGRQFTNVVGLRLKAEGARA